MKIKENDSLPNSEIFVLQDGEPVKKNIEDFFKDKKSCNIWTTWGIYFCMFC
jgi:hypothetical protein